MRISAQVLRFVGDRRATAPLETVMVLPVLAVALVLGTYLNTTFKTRNGVLSDMRSAAMSKSLNGYCVSLVGLGGRLSGALAGRPVTCGRTEEESLVPGNNRFWTRARSDASAFPQLIDQVRPRNPTRLVTATARAYFEGLDSPRIRFSLTSFDYAVVESEVWPHDSQPYKNGHDPVLYRELRKSGAYRLFPNVFPAAQR